MVRWINQPKNIYFLFFGVQNHLIFHWKLLGLGKFQSYDFFGFVGNLASQEPITGQVCDGKTAWKKNIEIVGSFNGITTTCKLMTGIFSQLRNNRRVSCLRNAIKSKTTHSRDSWHIEHAGISLWLVSVSLRKWSQTRTQSTTNQIPGAPNENIVQNHLNIA